MSPFQELYDKLCLPAHLFTSNKTNDYKTEKTFFVHQKRKPLSCTTQHEVTSRKKKHYDLNFEVEYLILMKIHTAYS